MWSNQENRVRKQVKNPCEVVAYAMHHTQLGKDFPRCRAVALYISMKEPSLSSKLERWLFHVNVLGSSSSQKVHKKLALTY